MGSDGEATNVHGDVRRSRLGGQAHSGLLLAGAQTAWAGAASAACCLRGSAQPDWKCPETQPHVHGIERSLFFHNCDIATCSEQQYFEIYFLVAKYHEAEGREENIL